MDGLPSLYDERVRVALLHSTQTYKKVYGGKPIKVKDEKEKKKKELKYHAPKLLGGRPHFAKKERFKVHLSRPDVHEEMKRERAEWLNSEVGYI